MRKKYRITLHGCDATYIDYQLTEDEYSLIKNLASESEKESSYVCQPIMEVEEIEGNNT